MNISYITTYDPMDVNRWSGLGFYISDTLVRQGNQLDYISPLEYRVNLAVRMKSWLHRKLSSRQFTLEREPYVALQMAKQIESRITPKTDIMFSPGSINVSMLERKVPKVIYTDATFASMLGYYDSFKQLCNMSVRDGHKLERHALSRSSLAIYASDWAASSAIRDYGADPAKVKVVPFGANIEHKPDMEEIREIIRRRSLNECHLLFLGVDWHRKGGAIALEAARILHESGMKVTLHIAGIRKPPMAIWPSYVIDHGYISKRTQEGRDQIRGLLEKCHLLVLPTRAEAYGLVFCEANAYGMPVLATHTGGVPTIVKEGVNGWLYPMEAGGEYYAARVRKIMEDRRTYEEYCMEAH
jgi:glycosyltransferase involved in cell wall biosynthesis